ncbi:hypothetical protein [Phaeobacter porticola]|uniref:Type IV pilus biogenesis n=1 Tax=Phaeobacter porticola TaxID=1844006 RepID=A0A1L3I6P9_9RHOB|nr:hypothetical protein [Phaeobacter porticola]APG47814.1 Type IV pilus biogenesis [Phaeobacter porticola]
MKPGFALSFSSHGVSLLQRAAGGWRQIGTVSLDVEDLGAALADLRQLGETYANGPIACKLIIPNDQIRYLSLDTGTSDAAGRRAAAERGLDGATPYRVDELSFDLSEDGAQTHVAAVAHETLQEAEDFALLHGFLPVSFVATPGNMDFLGEPFFGSSQTLLQSGETPVEPDGVAVVDIGPADPPAEIEEPADVGDIAPPDATSDTPKLSVEAVTISTTDGGQADEPKDSLLDLADDQEDPTHAQVAADDTLADVSADPDGYAQPRAAASSLQKDEQKTASALTTSTPTGFSTRRRKEGPAPLVAPVSAQADPKPIVTATASVAISSNTSEDGKHTVTAAPAPDGKPTASDSRRVVPHAALGAISLSDTAPAIGANAAKARPPKLSAKSLGAPKGMIPPAPKHSGATPVLPRDGLEEISLPDTPSDKKSLHEAGKAALLAGVAKQNVGGKPRFLGLALMAGLLIFMAIVAAWAILAGQQTRNAVSEDATAPVGAEVIIEPGEIAPQVSAIPDQPDDGTLLPPETVEDALSSTDTAVLDALRIDEGISPATGQPLSEDLDAAELVPEIDPETDVGQQQAEQDTPLTRAAQYAATGIWQHAPDTPATPSADSLDTLYVASIDPTDISEDAIALPAQDRFATDLELGAVSTPTAAGQQFQLDARGLVEATPEGTLNPDGIMVFLGRPEKVPPPTPARPDPQVAAAAEEDARQAILSELRPKRRPENLVEQNERAQLGGLSRAELGALRPRPRPAGLKPPEENSLPATAQAIAQSVIPRARPANFANLVDRAQRNRQRNAEPSIAEAVASAAPPRSVTPRIPSSASVARQATVDNAINLRRVNLIGVYGTPSNRRALILMPNGRYKKVKVGDRIDGGRVVAIGDSQLQYQKGNRNLTLKIPSG